MIAKNGATTQGGRTEEPDPRADPTKIRNQPALTTSTGLGWLIVGGLLAATGIAILVPMLDLALPSVAMTGI
ncbi:MAG TPA: hypothetical protein VGP10_02965, partial [Marisediminicola sp.]|nr:hypothetical protein [Marisediminicola sp.]